MLLAPRVLVLPVLSARSLHADLVRAAASCVCGLTGLLWAGLGPGGAGWGPGDPGTVLCQLGGGGGCAPSFPSPNSRWFKAVLEPGLFPSRGQTARASFRAQTGSLAEASRRSALLAFSQPPPPLGALRQAPHKVSQMSPYFVPCRPTDHWFSRASNTGDHKKVLECTTLSLSSPRPGRRGQTPHLGRREASFLKGLREAFPTEHQPGA